MAAAPRRTRRVVRNFIVAREAKIEMERKRIKEVVFLFCVMGEGLC
jgi:hypothetical protein